MLRLRRGKFNKRRGAYSSKYGNVKDPADNLTLEFFSRFPLSAAIAFLQLTVSFAL